MNVQDQIEAQEFFFSVAIVKVDFLLCFRLFVFSQISVPVARITIPVPDTPLPLHHAVSSG